MSDINTWVWERVDADDKLDEETKFLILAALEGDQALADLDGSNAKPERPESSHDVPEPAGAFLKQIRVQGFRGIGEKTQLDLAPKPGLTIVAGRNGSGKSSLAEALEVSLTGTTYRWEARTSQWKDAWRNLHTTAAPKIEVSLAEESVGTTKIAIEWNGDDLDDRTTYLHRPGQQRETGIRSLGWDGPLETYRPLMSYDELGGLLTASPSKLHDALATVLGLEQVTDAVKRLDLRAKALGQRSTKVTAAKTQLLMALRNLGDERAAQAEKLASARNPDLDAMRALATGVGDDDQLGGVLRSLASLRVPDAAEIQRAAHQLSAAVSAITAASGTAAELLERRTEIQSLALQAHEHEGDMSCPLCGEGQLTQDWAESTRADLEASRHQLRGLRIAREELATSRRTARALVTSAPSMLTTTKVDELSESLAAARAAWKEWSDAPAEDLGLVEHLKNKHSALAGAVDELAKSAQSVLDSRDDAWARAAEQLAAYTIELEAWLSEKPAADRAKKAHTWLKNNQVVLKNERVQPIAEKAAAIWADLRQESNVEIEGLTLAGMANRRHVSIRASVDGRESGALEVMSQGELHALALALFLPRATMPESPFRFVLLDDPVQAMDPAKVDGLVTVLSGIAKTRQVVVFSHDDRLPSAVRRASVPAQIMEVTRQQGSKVTIVNTFNPAQRYLRDAHGMVSDEGLPDDTLRRTLPALLRMALEAQARDVYFSVALGAGRVPAEVEKTWEDAKATRDRVSLAVYDEVRSLDDWLASKPYRNTGLGVCSSAVHKGLIGDPRYACDAVEKMVADLARRAA